MNGGFELRKPHALAAALACAGGQRFGQRNPSIGVISLFCVAARTQWCNTSSSVLTGVS
jgi:hypothetical protein